MSFCCSFLFMLQSTLVNEFMFIKKNAEEAVKYALDGRRSIFDDCLSVTLCARSALCARLAATWSSLVDRACPALVVRSSGGQVVIVTCDAKTQRASAAHVVYIIGFRQRQYRQAHFKWHAAPMTERQVARARSPFVKPEAVWPSEKSTIK